MTTTRPVTPRAAPSPRTAERDLDEADVFPEIRSLRKAVAMGDWAPAAQELSAFRGDHARAVAIRSAAEIAGSEGLFAAAAAGDGGTIGQLLLAARHIELAWASRDDDRPTEPEPDRALYFQRRLRQAERLLIDVCAAEPENVPAWELRLTTALGLRLHPAEQQRRYDRLVALNPQHFTGELRRLRQLYPHWGGSWDAALGYAREVSQRSSDASHTPTLIPTVHLDLWFAAGGTGRRLLADRAVQAEVAWAAWKSALHPAFGRPLLFIQAHGTFALYYSLIGKRQAAAPHFRAMGGRAGAYPWGQFDDPQWELTRRRRAAIGGE